VPAGGYPLSDSRPGCFHVVQSDKYQQDGISFCLGIPEKTFSCFPRRLKKTVSMQKERFSEMYSCRFCFGELGCLIIDNWFSFFRPVPSR